MLALSRRQAGDTEGSRAMPRIGIACAPWSGDFNCQSEQSAADDFADKWTVFWLCDHPNNPLSPITSHWESPGANRTKQRLDICISADTIVCVRFLKTLRISARGYSLFFVRSFAL